MPAAVTSGTMIEAAVRRDRLVAALGLGTVAALAWAWLLAAGRMADGAMLAPMAWTPAHAAMMLLMWWIMMAAMMLPAAAPVLLLQAATQRRRLPTARPYPAVALGTAGYLGVWGLFALLATFAQWALERSGLLSPMTMSAGHALGGILLLMAGLYQLTPLKQACLRHCRSPFAFLTAHWRPGAVGAVRLGLVHGAYCLGCCWLLMALLFVGGVMSPFWIGALALYVLLEKLGPYGERLSRVAGLLLLAAGCLLLWQAA
jgi:predicted metal-binding membrane protein